MTIFHVIKYSGMSDEELQEKLPLEIKEQWFRFTIDLVLENLCKNFSIPIQSEYFEKLRNIIPGKEYDFTYFQNYENMHLPAAAHYIRYAFTNELFESRMFFAIHSMKHFSNNHREELRKCANFLKRILEEYEGPI